MRCVGYNSSSLGNRFPGLSRYVMASSERLKMSKKNPQIHRCENLRSLTGCVGLGHVLNECRWKNENDYKGSCCGLILGACHGIRLGKLRKSKNKKNQSWLPDCMSRFGTWTSQLRSHWIATFIGLYCHGQQTVGLLFKLVWCNTAMVKARSAIV
jgi:hypothetical protein